MKVFLHICQKSKNHCLVYNIMQQLRNNVWPSCFATLLTGPSFNKSIPHLSTAFFPFSPLPDVRFSWARFMKWYFVQFHFSIRLDLLSWGKAGFRRHLIPKVSKNSYSAGTTLTGCLKSLVFEYKDIVILFTISNSFFQICYFIVVQAVYHMCVRSVNYTINILQTYLFDLIFFRLSSELIYNTTQ